jgi:hypothetical protein
MDAQKINAYLRQVADACGAKDWVAEYDPALVDDALASVEFEESQRASVRFSKAFWACSPEEQRHVVTHEVCHFHFRRMNELVEALTDDMPEDVAALFAGALAMFSRLFETCEEEAVERFARIIAPRLPLPNLI